MVGFVSAWRLALLSVAVIPGIAFAGGLYAYTLTGLTSKSRESYANAGIIAEQVIHDVDHPNSQRIVEVQWILYYFPFDLGEILFNKQMGYFPLASFCYYEVL